MINVLTGSRWWLCSGDSYTVILQSLFYAALITQMMCDMVAVAVVIILLSWGVLYVTKEHFLAADNIIKACSFFYCIMTSEQTSLMWELPTVTHYRWHRLVLFAAWRNHLCKYVHRMQCPATMWCAVLHSLYAVNNKSVCVKFSTIDTKYCNVVCVGWHHWSVSQPSTTHRSDCQHRCIRRRCRAGHCGCLCRLSFCCCWFRRCHLRYESGISRQTHVSVHPVSAPEARDKEAVPQGLVTSWEDPCTAALEGTAGACSSDETRHYSTCWSMV